MPQMLPLRARSLSLLLGTILLLIASPVHGQNDLSPSQKQKLGLRLQPVVEAAASPKDSNGSSAPIAAEPFRDGDATTKAETAPTYAVFVHTGDPGAVERTGAAVDSRFDGFVTARATAEQLRAIARLDAVEQVRASDRAQLHNDAAAAFVGARAVNEGMVNGTTYTGDGVLACVIDSGIDYDHPDFEDENGNSRIVSIWDQTVDTDGQTPRTRHPALFEGAESLNYGTEYHTAEIERGGLPTQDTTGHGTHVAGTVGASGHAEPAGTHTGVAPGVNYVIVKPRSDDQPRSTDALNGLRFCDKVARDKGVPLVVNKSLGTHDGPHDGTSEWASGIDEIVENGSASGRAVVVSAGNEGDKEIHTSTSIAGRTSETIRLNVPDYTAKTGSENDTFVSQIWFEGNPDATATVTTPNGATVTAAAGTTNARSTPRDGYIAVRNAVHAGNGHRFVEVVATDPTSFNIPTSGPWTVELQNDSSSAVAADGWITDHTIGVASETITYANGDTQSTVSIPGTATHAITVGSFMHRWRWHGADNRRHRRPTGTNRSRDISLFSSKGPRRGDAADLQKPEITAPGQNVVSSSSQHDALVSRSNLLPSGMHVSRQGTSTSAPVVAGAVALLLEKDPTLTASGIKTLLTETADEDAFTGSTPNATWGHGRLNVLDAMTTLVNDAGSATHDVVAYDSHPDSTYEQAVQLGGRGDDAHAIRFTPSNDGRLSGAYIHLSHPPAKNLTGPVAVAIYDDNGGVPGTQIGATVSIPPHRLRPGTWSFQTLLGTNTRLSAGETYYLVYKPENADDDLRVMAEKYDGSGHSLGRSSETWTEKPGIDLLVRPVVSSLSGVASFAAPLTPSVVTASTPDTSSIVLDWEAVGSEKLDAYRIYRDTKPIHGDSSTRTPLATIGPETTSYTDTDVTAGTTYYYRLTGSYQIAGVDDSETESGFSAERAVFLYPETVSTRVTRSFETASTSSDYRLVALPGAVDRPLSETIRGAAGTRWQAYRESSTGLVRFDDSTAFSFTPGTGFWLTATEPWTVQEDFSTVALQEGQAATIPVREGWNIISNPLDKDVSWTAVDSTTSGALQPLWGFDGSFSKASTFQSAKNGEAYYFFNDDADRESLVIPYPTAPVRKPLATKQTQASNSSLVTIRAQPAKANVSSTVQIGLGTDRTSSSAAPVVAPPGRFEPVRLRLTASADTDVLGRTSSLMQDRRRLENGGATFPLRVRRQGEGPVHITVDNLDALDTERAVLVRPSTGDVYNLRRAPSLTITPKNAAERLKIAVGTEQYIQEEQTSTRPNEITLTAYPNPIATTGTLAYTLPKASTVRLTLYDVMGRRVALLASGPTNAGRHRVSLDADQFSSGLYFGRLQTDGTTKTQKIMIVR